MKEQEFEIGDLVQLTGLTWRSDFPELYNTMTLIIGVGKHPRIAYDSGNIYDYLSIYCKETYVSGYEDYSATIVSNVYIP